MKHSMQMGRSVENVSKATSPHGSVNSVYSDEAIRIRKDRITNFKKSHISHSTGDLNLNRTNVSLFGDVQLNDSQFFEVMYVGKIRVSHKKLPPTFIDDAIPKFIAHDKMKMKSLELTVRQIENVEHQNLSTASVIQNDLKDNSNGSDAANNNNQEDCAEELKDKLKSIQRSDSINDIPRRSRSASIGCIEQNRTMVFILGRCDLRLISTDRKQVLLHKNFGDVVNVVQGTLSADHFGIICNETKDGRQEFIGYVFKCQSCSIAHDVVGSMSKSLETLENDKAEADEREKSTAVSCDHCPMVWYNKLCLAVEGLNEKKAYSVITKHIEELNTDDYEILMEKFFASDKVNDYSLTERNKFLMALVEAHCQMRQQRHVHDTIENRSEFLNQYLGGSTIFMKAKRSLTSSFDQFLKRRGSRDVIDGNNNFHHDEEQRKVRPGLMRSISLTTSAPQTSSLKSEVCERPQLNTLKMDMFLKVGNTSKENDTQSGTWRQNILKNVSDDATNSKGMDDSIKLLPTKAKKIQRIRKKRSSEELRDLWKFAGKQIILLIRMEKENARLQEKQNENEIRRIKLDYDDILMCDQKLAGVWEKFILQASRSDIDNRLFMQAIKSGIPRSIRGDVWIMLAKQYSKTHSLVDMSGFENFNVSYGELLKNLTEHQHAIFMDIGRTFPNHEYYKTPFGLGQLSLFNILKAYSILDPELGYCQGLAFICGVLLLHLSEDDAFMLLKHLMFERQLRLNYLPDMKHFQLQLYQLSRLIKDHLPEVHELFDRNEVATTLYASSWMLTIFSSSFELGFVTRIYDLLLYASNEVIFRVVLSILHVHKMELLKLNCFEDIMDYLKNVVPKVDATIMPAIFKHVYELNIARQLLDYKVEYNVLKDELVNTTQHVESLKMAREDIKNMQQQLQLSEANVERLEGTRHSQQQEIQSMQSHIKNLEANVQTLGDYITSLSISRTDIEIPSEIRRILQQLECQQQNKQQVKRRPVFLDRKIGKSVSVNNGLGMSLKVLIEQNESDNQTPPCAFTPTPDMQEQQQQPDTVVPRKKYFDKTFEQIKQQQNSRINSKLLQSRESPERPKLIEQAAINEENEQFIENDNQCQSHPLVCDDVNFNFNTMQLKSVKTTNAFKKQS